MSGTHNGGNLQNELNLEEHNGSINAKRVDASAATIYAVVNTSAAGVGQSMVTLNAGPNFIGLATVVQASSARSITGNVTLSDAKTYVGLVTATIGNSPSVSVVGNVTLSDSKGYIGLVTVTQASSARSITGNVTLSDAKTYVGLVTATIGNTPNVAVVGNVTLSDPKGFIGLATVINTYRSTATVYTQIVSNASATTIFVAPASNYFYVKDLMLGSLGNSFPEIRSGATTLIPFMSLATSGGYVSNFGETGLKSRAPADAFVVNMNSAVTVAVMVNVRFDTI